MIPPRALFFFFVGTLLLAGCTADDRAGTRIPPLPKTDAIQRREAALKLLSNLAARNPSAPDIFYQRARLYLETAQPEKALADVARAIELKGNVGNYFQVKAEALRALGRVPDALEAARQVEILEAGTPELYVLLGDLYQQTGQYAPARQYLNRAVQATPYNGEAVYFQALVTAKTGDTTTALGQFRRGLSLNPGYAATYQQLASIHNALNDPATARQFSEQGLKRFPTDATLHFQRGLSLQKLAQPDSALMSYQRAIALRPQFYEASFNAGILAFRANNLTGALRHFENVLRQNAKVPQLAYFIGQCYEYLGNPAKALDFYAQAQQEAPGDYRMAQAYGRVLRRLDVPTSYNEPRTTTAAPLLPQRRSADTALFRPIQIRPRLSTPKPDSGGRLVPRLPK